MQMFVILPLVMMISSSNGTAIEVKAPTSDPEVAWERKDLLRQLQHAGVEKEPNLDIVSIEN